MTSSRRYLVPLLTLVAALVLLGAAAVFTLMPMSGLRSPSAIGGAFELIDQNKEPVTEKALLGSPSIVFFGYTHCPDVCPTTLADWKRAKTELGEKAARVRWVFVTVDPERDSVSVAERYARQYDTTFVGLSGDAPTTAKVMEAYGVAAAREEGTTASGYLVSHSSQVFLLDGAGKLVALYPFGTRWEALAADLARLL
jgi:protein SCO1/2